MDSTENVVVSEYEKFLEEKRKQASYFSMGKVIKKTANYTGMLKNYKTIAHEVNNDENIKETNILQRFDMEKRINIYNNQRKRYFLLVNKENINGRFTEEMHPDYKSIVSWMGYQTTVTPVGNKILFEDPDVNFKRFTYLKQLQYFRETNQIIYYIDETIIDTSLSFKKIWMLDHAPTELFDSQVFYHIISNDFKTGLFCTHLVYGEFLKWLNDIVMPKLYPGSVLVFNESQFTTIQNDNCSVSKYDSKQEIIAKLKKNNIPCTEDLHKSELYQLAKTYLKPNKREHLIEVIEALGHKVLIKPKSLFDLTPNEIIWKNARHFVTEKSFQTLPELKALISTYWNKLNEVSPWPMIKTIEQMEAKLFDIEIETDKLLSKLR